MVSKIRDSIAVSKVLLEQIEEAVDYSAGKNASACGGEKEYSAEQIRRNCVQIREQMLRISKALDNWKWRDEV